MRKAFMTWILPLSARYRSLSTLVSAPWTLVGRLRSSLDAIIARPLSVSRMRIQTTRDVIAGCLNPDAPDGKLEVGSKFTSSFRRKVYHYY
jgi:hypothetical protein